MTSSLELGIKAFKERRFEESVALFEELTKVHPDQPKLRFMLGQSYQALDRLAEAQAAFHQAAQAKDPQLSALASKALAALSERLQAVAEVPQEPQLPERYCPQCGELIPHDRGETPWCVCGWGKRRQGNRLYLAHLLTLCKTNRCAVELKLHGDLYAIAQDVRIKHMSSHATIIDPRVVFRVDRGVPYIAKEDLDHILPKVDDQAHFRIKKGEAEIGVGKLLGWDEFLLYMRDRGGDPSQPPDGSLRSVLITYGNIPENTILAAEQDQDGRNLGTSLLESGACSLQELLTGALGSSFVQTPGHHHSNQLGRILLDAGALSDHDLKRALVTQLKTKRSLQSLVKALVPPPALRQAQVQMERLPVQAPDRDRIGEILYQMGALSRTDLVHALQERSKQKKLFGKLLLERGMVTAESLFEALKRQELKQAARFKGEVRIGHILIANGFCSPKAVATALVKQIHQPRPLGDLLIRDGMLTPEQLITALVEQETALEALVAERLPEELEKSKMETTINAPKAKRRERIPLPDELARDEKEKNKPLFRPGFVVGLIGVAVCATAVSFIAARPEAPPAEKTSPMLKAIPASSAIANGGAVANGGAARVAAGVPAGKTFSSLSAQNVVEVDMDQVIDRMEKGDPNPLGEGYMGAYKQPLPASLEQAAAQMAPLATQANQARTAQPRVTGVRSARLAAETRPVADFDEGDDPTQILQAAPQRQAAPRPTEKALIEETQRAPDDPTAWGELGALRLAKGNSAGAVKALEVAVKADPRNQVYYNKLGLAFKNQGRTEEAASAFESALKADPKNPNSHHNLALIKAGSDPRGARKHYAKAIDGFADLVESRLAFGEALKVQGDVPGAIKSYQGALKANTLLAESHLGIGKLDLAEKQYDRAKESFAAAKATYRTNAIAHSLIGDSYASLKRPKEAMEEWVVSTRIAPFYAPPFYQLGLMAKAQGKRQDAKRFLQQAIDADPTSELVAQAKRHLSELQAAPKRNGKR